MKTKLLLCILALAPVLFFTTYANDIETKRLHENSSPLKKADETASNPISDTSINSSIEFSLTGFTLVDSETDEDLFSLTNGLKIDRATIIGKKLNIRVDTQGDVSNVFVDFQLTGPNNEVSNRENFAPFTVFGDSNGDYAGKELSEGNYIISANAENPLLNEFAGSFVSFTIVGPPRITGVLATMKLNTHYPTEQLDMSFPIEDGAVYDRNQQSTLPSIPPFAFNTTFIARPNNRVGSVKFRMSGPITLNRTENVAPYTLFGDIENSLNYSNEPFPTGTYTLVITPYSEPQLQGERGEVLTITFTVIDDGIVKPKILDMVYSIGGDGGPFDSPSSIMIPTEPFFYQPASIIALGNTDTKSVEMKLTSSNGFSYDTVENLVPYGFNLFGRSYAPALRRGIYSLTITPYSEFDKGGVAGETITKHFEFAVIEAVIYFAFSNETFNFERFFPFFNGALFNNSGSRNHFTLPVAINATTDPEEVGSVKFEIKNENGYSYTRIENVAPYTLFGDSNGVFNSRLLPEGTYHLTATPFSAPNGKGDIGISESITFYITNYFETAMPELRLIEAESTAQITTLSANQKTTIDQSVTPTDHVNIIAEYDCSIYANCPESVRFTLTGAQNKTSIESNEPYSLFGDYDRTGTFFGESLPVGEYTLTVWAYQEDGAKGLSTIASTYDFEIRNVNSLMVKANNIVLYPNPASDMTFVKTEDNTSIFKTIISDITGKKVKEYTRSVGSEQDIDVTGLKKGLYIVQIDTGNERITKKLVVN